MGQERMAALGVKEARIRAQAAQLHRLASGALPPPLTKGSRLPCNGVVTSLIYCKGVTTLLRQKWGKRGVDPRAGRPAPPPRPRSPPPFPCTGVVTPSQGDCVLLNLINLGL